MTHSQFASNVISHQLKRDKTKHKSINSIRKYLNLKCYYDKKFTSLFPSDFKSVFVWHLTGKILSFEFYPKAVFFECKFRISRSAIVRVQKWPNWLQRVGSRIRWRQRLASLKLQHVNAAYCTCKTRVWKFDTSVLHIGLFRRVHTHCIFKPVSLWRHLILDPALWKFES